MGHQPLSVHVSGILCWWTKQTTNSDCLYFRTRVSLGEILDRKLITLRQLVVMSYRYIDVTKFFFKFSVSVIRCSEDELWKWGSVHARAEIGKQTKRQPCHPQSSPQKRVSIRGPFYVMFIAVFLISPLPVSPE